MAMEWLLHNPTTLLLYHAAGQFFLGIVPKTPNGGVVLTATDEEEFEAKLNDLRPSIRKQLFLTHTGLWVKGVKEWH